MRMKKKKEFISVGTVSYRPNYARSRKSLHGFTLVELLVVISIIALLLSILMPSLRRVRMAAQGIVCRVNVRSISMAWFMYADDNDGKLIGADPYRQTAFAWVRDPEAPYSLEEKWDGIRRGKLFDYVKSVEVYHCPADMRSKRPPNPIYWLAPEGGYRSYSIPHGMGGVVTSAVEREWVADRYTQIKNPSMKLIFLETDDDRGWNWGDWWMCTGDYGYIYRWMDKMAMFHGPETTLGFADGHSEMHRWKDKRTVEFKGAVTVSDSEAFHPFSVDWEYMVYAYQPKK